MSWNLRFDHYIEVEIIDSDYKKKHFLGFRRFWEEYQGKRSFCVISDPNFEGTSLREFWEFEGEPWHFSRSPSCSTHVSGSRREVFREPKNKIGVKVLAVRKYIPKNVAPFIFVSKSHLILSPVFNSYFSAILGAISISPLQN